MSCQYFHIFSVLLNKGIYQSTYVHTVERKDYLLNSTCNTKLHWSFNYNYFVTAV